MPAIQKVIICLYDSNFTWHGHWHRCPWKWLSFLNVNGNSIRYKKCLCNRCCMLQAAPDHLLSFVKKMSKFIVIYPREHIWRSLRTGGRARGRDDKSISLGQKPSLVAFFDKSNKFKGVPNSFWLKSRVFSEGLVFAHIRDENITTQTKGAVSI